MTAKIKNVTPVSGLNFPYLNDHSVSSSHGSFSLMVSSSIAVKKGNPKSIL